MQLGITYENLPRLSKLAQKSIDLLLVVLPSLSPRRLKRALRLSEAALRENGQLILVTEGEADEQ